MCIPVISILVSQRKDSGELAGQPMINENTQSFSKNVENREGLPGWSVETTEWPSVALVIRTPEVGLASH